MFTTIEQKGVRQGLFFLSSLPSLLNFECSPCNLVFVGERRTIDPVILLQILVRVPRDPRTPLTIARSPFIRVNYGVAYFQNDPHTNRIFHAEQFVRV